MDMKRRDMLKSSGAAAGLTWLGLPDVTLGDTRKSKLRVAACRFATDVEVGAPTHGRTDAVAQHVAGPLKTTVMLLEDGSQRVCLVATDFMADFRSVSLFLRKEVAKVTGLDVSRILICSAHDHSIPRLFEVEAGDARSYEKKDDELPAVKLLPVGERFIAALRQHLARLPEALEPVTVLWAQGQEGRITYNRKGRRADGSTYLMREEDRVLVGKDFNGDIDRQVPVVVFQGLNGKPVAALLQFTGHPVTSYHPEKFTMFGDYPAVASDLLGQALGEGGRPVPVAFLQGCAGDISSKEMFVGGVARAKEFGEMLGQSAVAALASLKPSRRDGMDYAEQIVALPLAPLPSKETLLVEKTEMEDFVRRAKAGDENTLSCVGLNFPHALSPAYRGILVNMPLVWNEWALSMYRQGRENSVMRTLDVPIHVLRLGDVAVVAMPFEPFMGIGRRIRALSPCPLTIPCGYVNGSHGYVTDSANTGDREYMSAFYRYTQFRPPYAKPAGDVVADRAAEMLRGFWKQSV